MSSKKDFTKRVIEGTIYPVLRPYIAWLGTEYHRKRVPAYVNDHSQMIVFNVDTLPGRGREHQLTWTIYGLDQVYCIRVETQHDDAGKVTFEAERGYTLTEAMVAITMVIQDIHDQLIRYMDDNGWVDYNIEI